MTVVGCATAPTNTHQWTISSWATDKVTVPAHTSPWSVFSHVSFACESSMPMAVSGHRLPMSFEPPSSSGIRWSISYAPDVGVVMPYSVYTLAFVDAVTARTVAV